MSDRTTAPETPGGAWSLWRAFLLGAALGALIGFAVGWMRYGAFEPGHFANHVLGGLLLVGVACVALAAMRNWLRRNPV